MFMYDEKHYPIKHYSERRGYSSVVEHSTADREVPGSNPGVPSFLLIKILIEF